MTFEQALAFAIIGGMMGLFVWGRLRYDLVALLTLLTSVAVGIVPPERAFTGFGDEIVVIVASALIVSAAVARSGITESLLRPLVPHLTSVGRQVLVLAAAVAALSAFVKNVGALAIVMPMAFERARRTGTPPTYLLMPLAFGSLLGGLTTLIGTSPNIIVSRMRADLVGQPFEMFDFTPVGGALPLPAWPSSLSAIACCRRAARERLRSRRPSNSRATRPTPGCRPIRRWSARPWPNRSA